MCRKETSRVCALSSTDLSFIFNSLDRAQVVHVSENNYTSSHEHAEGGVKMKQ